LERELAELRERVAKDPSKVLGDEWDLPEADREQLARPEIAEVIRESTDDLLRGGPWGGLDDELAFLRPWGFEVAEITVPVEVRYGAQDVLVPAAHGGWLADHVPGATVVVEDGQGHLSDLDRVVELTTWLVKGT